ncbi:MAG: Xaa-Pro peptidase family protein [Dysgonamonadaceae bacterium]|jgi:Xaa-Pro aminopeptidase|nr:Xaa-Pro peptidase family protein [Dysgonamonadaceae bacterium]
MTTDNKIQANHAHAFKDDCVFPPEGDLKIRWRAVQKHLLEAGGDACLITTTVNIYYLTGMVFTGFIYFSVEGDPLYFVQRPIGYEGAQIVAIRKPEEIPDLLKARNIPLPKNLFLEGDQITFSELLRLATTFNPENSGNATTILRKARMIKTPWEIGQFRISAAKHAEAYRTIPSLFEEGMRDIDFQTEIERQMRKHGSIGIFRTFGGNMDIFMGSLLTGDNAGMPSPYDFALGGGGMHPCLPIGAAGEVIKKGNSVMVDMAGNFTAYMSDMSRVFSFGKLSEKALDAHKLSMEMHDRLMAEGKEGIACADIYKWSLAMAEKAGFGENFMGLKQQAKFVGHGVGIEINELPVLMERSKDLLQSGCVFAFEPKFVLPGTGAVGNENTYLITETGIEKLTVLAEEIIELIG